jgi:hypothetical protein
MPGSCGAFCHRVNISSGRSPASPPSSSGGWTPRFPLHFIHGGDLEPALGGGIPRPGRDRHRLDHCVGRQVVPGAAVHIVHHERLDERDRPVGHEFSDRLRAGGEVDALAGYSTPIRNSISPASRPLDHRAGCVGSGSGMEAIGGQTRGRALESIGPTTGGQQPRSRQGMTNPLRWTSLPRGPRPHRAAVIHATITMTGRSAEHSADTAGCPPATRSILVYERAQGPRPLWTSPDSSGHRLSDVGLR